MLVATAVTAAAAASSAATKSPKLALRQNIDATVIELRSVIRTDCLT